VLVAVAKVVLAELARGVAQGLPNPLAISEEVKFWTLFSQALSSKRPPNAPSHETRKQRVIPQAS